MIKINKRSLRIVHKHKIIKIEDPKTISSFTFRCKSNEAQLAVIKVFLLCMFQTGSQGKEKLELVLGTSIKYRIPVSFAGEGPSRKKVLCYHSFLTSISLVLTLAASPTASMMIALNVPAALCTEIKTNHLTECVVIEDSGMFREHKLSPGKMVIVFVATRTVRAITFDSHCAHGRCFKNMPRFIPRSHAHAT